MKFIDLHCDTASKIFYEDIKLKKNNLQVDIEKLIQGDALMQVFAFFIDLKEIKKTPFEEFMAMYNRFLIEVKENREFLNLYRGEIVENKINACLSIEEGEVLEGNPYNVEKVANMGIKLITLTWNYENSIGFPNFEYKYSNEGLKNTGFEIVDEMERLGVIVDCSHLSDRGFLDLAKRCKKPFIATHSNAREVTNHPRNLTDPMLKILGEKGGVAGINFCNAFVGDSFETKIKDLVNHMEHMKNKGGSDILALGSDFDGIGNPVEIKDCSKMGKMAEFMKKRGFKEDEIEKAFYKNALRIFK